MKGHPRDEWVKVTSLGAAAPEYLLARDGREVVIAEAKAQYVAGQITIEEFEAVVAKELE